MTIEELRKQKAKAENTIRAIIVRFEDETGVKIRNVDHDRFSYDSEKEEYVPDDHKITISLDL